MDPRSAAAVAVLLVLAGGAWWVATLAPEEAGPGTHAVVVVAPDGSVLANGTVEVEEATALSALLALAQQAGFEVGHESLAGFAGCSSAYVRSIGPYAETATGGWNYYTRRPGGDWEWESAGAGCALPAGAEVEWCWVERDRCEHHVA